MKTKLILLALFAATAARASAAVLNATAAVHTRPDEASPSITFLKAGSEPVPAKDALATTPAGWLAVELPGPFECYVQNRDLTKSEDPRLGANLYLRPKADSGVLTTFEPGDKSRITGVPPGRWTQLSVDKKLVGYVRIGAATSALPSIATAPATNASPAPAQPAPMAPAPTSPTAYGSAAPGQAAPVVTLNDPVVGDTLPRLLAGKFVSTRSAFHPRRPYDWALNDDAGSRVAYLDLSRLLLTEQIENYVDHAVVVFGAVHAVPGTKDIVIGVESLQLK